MAARSWTSALLVAVATALAATLNVGTSRDGTTQGGAGAPAADPAPSFLRAHEAERPSAAVVGIVPSADADVGRKLVDGARRALDEARAAGGPDLAIVVAELPAGWGSVASETVRLACEEHVVAVVGPPERVLAHPVAQAATRCRVPMISTSPAESVTAAGTRWVLSVATPGATPEEQGYDAARVIVDAVRRAGLVRDAVLAAATDGIGVTGRTGVIRFGPFGRRESAAK